MAGNELKARPNLSNFQFKQTVDSELDLNGIIRFLNESGLILKGDNGDVVVTAINGIIGQVLTLTEDGKIELADSEANANISFPLGNTTITRFIDNPQYNINANATTMLEFLENFFFPSVVPLTILEIQNGISIKQFGDKTPINLTWNVLRNSSEINSIKITTTDANPTHNMTPITGNSDNGIVEFLLIDNIPTPITPTISTNIEYSLTATTIENEISNISTRKITWMNKIFKFKSGTHYTSSNIGNLLNNTPGELLAVKEINETLTFENEFFYYAYPKVLGLPIFVVNGIINNAWGNLDSETLFTITHVNSNNYSAEYYVCRSDNKISGTFNIVVQ